MDLCLMIFVAHHLNPLDLQAALREASRVLRKNGRLFLVDPIWNSKNLIGRLLWWLDQGHYKRTGKDLTESVNKIMFIINRKPIRVLHDYQMFWCRAKD